MNHLQTLKANIQKLEVALTQKTNVNFIGKLSVELSRNERYINIESEDLSIQLCPIGALLFKTITFDACAAIDYIKDNKIRFSRPSFSYKHQTGGSNGCNVICDVIVFDFTTEQFELISY